MGLLLQNTSPDPGELPGDHRFSPSISDNLVPFSWCWQSFSFMDHLPGKRASPGAWQGSDASDPSISPWSSHRPYPSFPSTGSISARHYALTWYCRCLPPFKIKNCWKLMPPSRAGFKQHFKATAPQGRSTLCSHTLLRVVTKKRDQEDNPPPHFLSSLSLAPPPPVQGDTEGWPSHPGTLDQLRWAAWLAPRQVSQPILTQGPSRRTSSPPAKAENDAEADYRLFESNLASKPGCPIGSKGSKVRRCPNPPSQTPGHSMALGMRQPHTAHICHTLQALYTPSASQIPQISGSKAIKQPREKEQSGGSFLNSECGRRGREAFPLCYGPEWSLLRLEPAQIPAGQQGMLTPALGAVTRWL